MSETPKRPSGDTPDDPTLRAESPRSAVRFPVVPGYEVLRLLGEGGMGAVYEARQETPRRQVALKVIRSGGYVSDEQVRLFRREIESLGRLSHPSIATIFDAGRTSFGQHFFAMELVRGITLDVWLRETAGPVPDTRTALRERIELFVEVCDAIHYAHQRGVIHRDLKPSNLVVTDRGDTTSSSHEHYPRIKVLDFGLARITDADVTLTGTEMDVGKVQGTLAYMSPEQARGDADAIDTRTDVYSLGVILHELLTGDRPYDVRKPAIHEAIRVIEEQVPRRPSTPVPALRGDLDTIVLKALEKEPDRRYLSVAALAEDLRRFLDSQPILAHPPSTLYHVRKLVARHKTPAALLATLAVVVVAAAITMTVLFENQRRARVKAEAANFLALGRLEDNSSRAAAYALKSLELEDTRATRHFALESLWRNPTVVALFFSPTSDKVFPHSWSVDFSPDGRFLVIGDVNGRAFLWPADSAEPFEFAAEESHCVRFGPGSDAIYAFSDESDSVRIRSVPDGRPLGALGFNEAPEAAMSADRRYLVTRTGSDWRQSEPGPIRIEVWNLEESRPRRVGERLIEAAWPEGMSSNVTLAAVTGERLIWARGRFVESVGLDDLAAPAILGGAHEEPIRALAFHPDGDRVAAVDGSGEIRIWSLSAGPSSPTRSFRGQPSAWGPARFSPDGSRLATAGDNGIVQVWEPEGPPDQAPIELGQRGVFPVNDVVFHPVGNLLGTAGGGWVPQIRVFGVPYPWILRGHTREASSVVFGLDGSWIASLAADEIRTWPLTPGSMPGRSFPGEFRGVDADPRSRFLLAWGREQEEKLLLFSLEDGNAIELPVLPEGVIVCGAVGPRGRRVAAGYGEGNNVIQIQDLETGETRILDAGEMSGIFQVEFLPENHLLSASYRDKFRLWNLEDGTHEVLDDWVWSLEDGSQEKIDERVWRFAVSPDGRSLLTLQVRPWLAFRDLDTRSFRELRSHGASVRAVAFDPSGTRVVTSDEFGVIRVGPVTGEEPHLLLGHEGMVEGVAVSPDGQWIASSGADRTVRVWRMPEGAPLHTLPRDGFLQHLRLATNFRIVPTWNPANVSGYSFFIDNSEGWGGVARYFNSTTFRVAR